MDNTIENEEIVEVVSNTEAINRTNPNISVEPLPSQYLQAFDNIYSLGGQEFHLNGSGTKRLVIGITSREIPELKVVFKLHDTKNGRFIQFSKKTWERIIHHSDSINNYMEIGAFDEVFDDNRIRATTTTLYNRFCVVFTDRTETCIAMMPETFNTMISLKDEIEFKYTELYKNIQNVTKRMKLFMDISFFHLLKSNNIDCRHNYNWLAMFLNKSDNFLELNNSIANTWLELGKWIDSRNQDEEQATTETALNDT